MTEATERDPKQPRLLCCSVTAAGAALARRLPFEHAQGSLVSTVAERWNQVDGLILIGATGIAVRATAPHLSSKATDPAVVAVDDGGRFAIALTGGHAGGANELARQVGALLGAQPVVTTATDVSGRPGLDDLPGFAASGDVASVSRRWLDGEALVVAVDDDLAQWPLPSPLQAATASLSASSPSGTGAGVPRPATGADVLRSATGADVLRPATGADVLRPATGADVLRPATGADVTITDRSASPARGRMVLRPKSLVLGVGSSSGALPSRLDDLVNRALHDGGLAAQSVGLVATLDRKAGEPAILRLASSYHSRLRTFTAEELAVVPVPTPSVAVAAAVGTPSVCEAAALLAAGPGSSLVVTKRADIDATVAVARRAGPEGRLAVVGLGPGDPAQRTPAATAAVRHAEMVIGYGPYVDLAADLLHPAQVVLRSPIGDERDRCREALTRASGGISVALVCSGDAGVYAMASLVCEMASAYGNPPVTVVAGVTAAVAAAAVLGAPLGHDHCSISLSDLLTPWEVIEGRLRAAADGDFVVALYNPRSAKRRAQLPRALAILASRRPGTTPAAVVTDVGRSGQKVVRTTLAALDPGIVGMLSLVIVGASSTRWIGDSMVTPRGYEP